MPLVIKVELHHSKTGEVTELGRMRISNVGGTVTLGDYMVLVELPNGELTASGSVTRHARLTEPVWSLVAKALKSVGFG